ncbi:MAG: nucleotide exchange factor GrpE [Armatimonadota bacterium]|nr:nucleotide exchange factor GrpE [Armatimonadota bacterium]MDW8025240.1 nucleotide exchange factor GrpE [Armatimonadota bacterium]
MALNDEQGKDELASGGAADVKQNDAVCGEANLTAFSFAEKDEAANAVKVNEQAPMPREGKVEAQTVESIQAEVEQLRERLEEVTREAEELRNRWLRAVAEYQNLRRRVMSERAFAFREGKRQALVELLCVIDDLERSIEAAKDATDLEAIKTGIELVHRRFISALNKLGVRVIPTLNEHFEPQYHEAVERVETDQFEEGTILEEVQRGYMMDEIVLRPAKVKVAVAPSAKGDKLSGLDSPSGDESN